MARALAKVQTLILFLNLWPSFFVWLRVKYQRTKQHKVLSIFLLLQGLNKNKTFFFIIIIAKG